jgi:hypothetical protein
MASDDYPGKEILGSKVPREVLARLVDGDPLEVAARCVERVRSEGWFIAVDRLQLRSLARIAHAAPIPLDLWLQERIDMSIADLLREDREEERSGIPPSSPWDPRYAFVSETLGIAPEEGRRACNAFNALPLDVRQTYFAVYVDGKTIRRWVAEGNGPPEKVHDHLRRAFAALSLRYGEGRRGYEEDEDE